MKAFAVRANHPEAREVWARVERAAQDTPEWVKERILGTAREGDNAEVCRESDR